MMLTAQNPVAMKNLMHGDSVSPAGQTTAKGPGNRPVLDGIDRVRELVTSIDASSGKADLKAYAARVQDECDVLLARVTAATAKTDGDQKYSASIRLVPQYKSNAAALPPKPTDTVQGRRLASGISAPPEQLSVAVPKSPPVRAAQASPSGSGMLPPAGFVPSPPKGTVQSSPKSGGVPSPPRGPNSSHPSPRTPHMNPSHLTSPRVSPRTQGSPKTSNLFSQWAHPETFSPSSLRRRVETLERQLSDLTNQNVDMTGELHTRQKQIQQLTNQNAFLQQQLARAQAESTSFQDQVAQLSSHMQMLLNRSYVQTAKLEDTNAKLSKVTDEKAQLEAQIKALHAAKDATSTWSSFPSTGSRAATTCAICSQRAPSAALVPCGHRFCGTCSADLSTCPDCSVKVVTRVDLLEC